MWVSSSFRLRRREPAQARIMSGHDLEYNRADVDDLDPDTRVLAITESKFGKSRLAPMLPDTTETRVGYASLRSSYRPRPGNDSFFVSRTGRRMIYESVFEVFDLARPTTRIGSGAVRRPRSHDLRHWVDCWVMCPVCVFVLVSELWPGWLSA